MEKKAKKNQYVRQWRVTERSRRRHNAFISDYVKIKFGNVYNEGVCFFNALNNLYPEKLDLRKTKEYRNWKQAIKNTSNPESAIIVQTLSTTTETVMNEGQQNEILSYNEEISSESNNEESSSESNNEESGSESNSEESGSESNSEESDTESNTEINTEENQGEMDEESQTYNDNMLLQIPLQDYFTITKPQADSTDYNVEISPGDDFQPFTDERLREIIDELRNDPELQNIFVDPHPENVDQEDEGVELPTLEEEVELDFEPFDYRLEVELEDW